MKTHAPTQPSDEALAFAPSEAPAALVSALVDGEWSDMAWDDARGSQVLNLSDDGLVEDWHSHHLIGEVLRGEFSGRAVSTGALTAHGAQSFARQVLAQARQDLSNGADPVLPTVSGPVGALGTAGSRPVAANDATFRWKLVAGVATVTALGSFAWVMLGTWGGMGSAEAPLAEAPPPSPATVVVATDQGLVERDARMQALIQAHRQAGGGTAWQAPAGFLRAATHDDLRR